MTSEVLTKENTISASKKYNFLELSQSEFYAKFRCWTCGLYLNEPKVCLNCSNCNSWTLVKTNNNSKKIAL